jgi:hypothetical protein
MSKTPSPRLDALRAMREANFDAAEKAQKKDAKPAKKKPIGTLPDASAAGTAQAHSNRRSGPTSRV